MKGREFIFDSVQMMYCRCDEVNFRCSDSYFNSPDWVKKKKATINPKNEDDKCFQYVVTITIILWRN